MPPLYTNSASSLPNASAGKLYSIVIRIESNRYDLDAHHNLQNLVAMSQVNNGGKLELYRI
jgi:hypothetical protein